MSGESLSPTPDAVEHLDQSFNWQMIDPILLTERLEVGQLQAMPREKPGMVQAWEPIEQLIADSSKNEYLDARIEKGYTIALQLVNSPSLRRQLHAQMFLANFDLLALRAHGRSIEKDDLIRSYFMMARTLENNIEKYGEAGADAISDMVTYALIARRGDKMNIPFLASPRESHLTSQRHSHDLYTTDEDLTIKTAIRTDDSRRRKKDGFRSNDIYKHNAQIFFERNTKDIKHVNALSLENPDYSLEYIVAQLIIGEPDEGYESGSEEDKALSTLSSRLLISLNEHRLRLLGMSGPTKGGSTIKSMVSPAVVSSAVLTAASRPTPGAPHIPVRRARDLPPKAYVMREYGRDFMNPFVLAEHMPPEVIEGQIDNDPIFDGAIVGGLWKTVELGLATYSSDAVLTAGEQAREISRDDSHDANVRLAAAKLFANSNLLAQRVSPDLTPASEIWESFLNMAQVLKRLQSGKFYHRDLDISYEDFVGIRAELVSYCLVAYARNTQFIPYIASHREERTPVPFLNHDMYTLPGRRNVSKVAAQIKQSPHARSYQHLGTHDAPRHTFMFPIYAKTMLHEKVTEMGLSAPHRTGLREAARLIMRASAEILTTQEEIRLQEFSDSMIELFRNHREFLRTKTKFQKMPYTTARSTQEFLAGL